MAFEKVNDALDTAPLSDALHRLHKKMSNEYGWGGWTKIGKASGLRSSSIARVARREVQPLPSTWDKLFEAFPKDIPAPPWEDAPEPDPTPTDPSQWDISTLDDMVKQREAYLREDGVDALAQAAEYWRRVAEVGVDGSPKPELVMQLLAIGIAEAVIMEVPV